MYLAYVSRYEEMARRVFDSTRHKRDEFFLFKFQGHRIYFSIQNYRIYPFFNRKINEEKLLDIKKHPVYNSACRFKRFEVDRVAVDRRRLETS